MLWHALYNLTFFLFFSATCEIVAIIDTAETKWRLACWMFTQLGFLTFIVVVLTVRKWQEWVSVNLSKVSLPPPSVRHSGSVLLLLCFSTSLLWPFVETFTPPSSPRCWKVCVGRLSL